MNAMQWSVAALAMAASLVTAAPVFSQHYPVRPIRVIVPFAPGGGSDILARMLSTPMSERLGQPVVVDNRPAGAGILGTELAARAASDGYTLLVAQAAHAQNSRLYARLPYDPINDFAPISLIVAASGGMFLHPSIPVRTVKEFIAYAKANPGKINFGSAGLGSSNHLSAELFSSMAGINMNHVPYKGAGQVVTALLSNEVQFAFNPMMATRTFALAGKLRLVAFSGAKRLQSMPDVPTIAESGLPGYESSGWWGYLAQRKVVRPIVERLHKEITAVATAADVRQTYSAQGAEIIANTPEEFAKIMLADAEKWGTLGKKLGIRLD